MHALIALPPQPTPFIGRKGAREAIIPLLADADCRLLTLVGAGGIGKTRLALEVASEIAPEYLDGAVFVGLQPLSASDQVIHAIADAVGYQFYGTTDPKIQLLNHLANLTALLVIDNFEHLVDCAPLLSEIVAHAPCVKLIVTSREILNLREEWVYRVEAMNFPSVDTHSDVPEQLEKYDAVRLFEHHARRAQPQFSQADEYAHVIRICQRVNGLPLALELAAAWLRRLPCSEIVQELNRGLDILASGARNLEPRHSSIRNVFDQSWRLLNDHERDVMMRASVFHGGFMRHAAEKVMAASLMTLADLVDKSMLHVDAAGRYHLHELVRQYASEQLDLAGLSEGTLHAHSVYYLHFMAERETDLKGHRQLIARAEIQSEIENFRAAWQTALETKNGETVYCALEAMRMYFDLMSQQDQAVDLLVAAEVQFTSEYILSDNPYPGLLCAWITAHRIWLSWVGPGYDFSTASVEIRNILNIAERVGDVRLIAFAKNLAALLNHIFWDNSLRLKLFSESLALFQQLNDSFWIADTLVMIGVCHREALRDAEMFACWHQALELQLRDGNKHAAGWTLGHIGYMQALINQAVKEKLYAVNDETNLAQAKAYFDEIGTPKGKAFLIWMENKIALQSGDFERGKQLAQQSLRFMQSVSNDGGIKSAMSSLAFFAILQGDYAEGKGICQQLMISSRTERALTDYAGLAIVASLEGDNAEAKQLFHTLLLPMTLQVLPAHVSITLSTAAIILAYDSGDDRATNRLRTVQLLGQVFHYPTSWLGFLNNWKLLTDLCTELETELGTAAYNAAWDYGKSRDLADVFHELQIEFGGVQIESDTPVAAANPDDLTDRESEILALIASGSSNREIADSLVLAIGTVKWYITQIYGKMGVNSRTQAVAHARKRGLLA